MNTIANEPRTFAEVRARLEEIVTEVRNTDVPLEKSLDLYEEAVRLGGICSDMVDKTNYSVEEAEAINLASDVEGADQSEVTEDGATGEEAVSPDDAVPEAQDESYAQDVPDVYDVPDAQDVPDVPDTEMPSEV